MWMIGRDESNWLAHHGIKGQKWGIRRFQNEDGSLTPEGERRYGHMKDFSNKSSVTKKVMQSWWDEDDDTFWKHYHVSKDEYAARVRKYGDPYMNSPMAQWAKKQNAKKAAKLRQAKNPNSHINNVTRSRIEGDLKGTGMHLSKDDYIKKHEKR